MILFLNACVRENSRTKKIADYLLSKLSGKIEQLDLHDMSFPTVNEQFLKTRDKCISKMDFDNHLFDLARQFARADEIVIAAPYWDLSFPAALKRYLELVNVIGITFYYTSDGLPKSLCKAEKLYYVTTAGGKSVPLDFGFGYIEALAQKFYGIQEIKLIKAEGLDIDGVDCEKILRDAIADIS